MCSKIVRLMTIRNWPKWTISANGGLGQLQMVSELDTGRCASEDIELPMGVNCEVVRSHIGWSGERNISFRGVETSP